MNPLLRPDFTLSRMRAEDAISDLHRLASRDAPDAVFGYYPPWSPAKLGQPFPKPIDQIFHKNLFYGLQQSDPSKTTVRLLNEKITRLRQRGIAPEWLPPARFEPSDLAHLLVLALANGAAAALDLADIAEGIPKFFRWIDDAINVAIEITDSDDSVEFKPKSIALFVAAAKLVGLLPNRRGMFFSMIENPELNDEPEVQFLFEWVIDGIGEQNLCRAAERCWKKYGTNYEEGIYALHFLDPRIFREAEERFDEIWKEVEAKIEAERANGIQLADHLESSSAARPYLPAKEISLRKEPTALPSRRGSEAFPGVVLTARALKEINRERWIAEDRLADGLALLGQYRRMRLGEISHEAYHHAVRSERFIDAPCFADPGSLRAFADYYTVAEDGVRYALERHLKWGKGNNAYTAIRIYYAWDAVNERVIVGSAPRHLPIWSH